MTALSVLVLLGVANFAPILATRLFGQRWAAPLDGGAVLSDGRPLFGAGKTIRGIVLSILCTAAAAPLLHVGIAVGMFIAAASMAGDLLASFFKRRMGLPAHARAPGLDQVPEALLPLILLASGGCLRWRDAAYIAVAFVVLDVVLSRVLYRLHVRDSPY